VNVQVCPACVDVQQTDASGNIKEKWYYGSKGELLDHTVDTYVLKTDVWTWTNYAENGSVKVALQTQNGKVNFYRQNVDDQNAAFGKYFSLDRVGTIQQRFRGHADGTFDDIVTSYPDEQVHNPHLPEWRDGTGTLRLKVEYDYDLDGQGNWTMRRTWVWTPELSEKKLYLADRRALTYWGN
jgi:hypothetical protein